jgi:2-polyprenyl-3-methyl-5-hydroxy-6-metoxy-1,4-benzoquinol methylase
MYQQTLHFTKTAELCAAITTAHREAAKRLNRDITDEMAVPSYLKGNLFSRWVFWGRLRHVVRQARLRPGTKVFDFGCGTGVLLSRLAAEGRTVYGTDLHLDIARRLITELKLQRVDLLAADRWQQAVPDGQMDTIIAADVLEHIEERQELLSNLGRKLAPGGRLVICGPTENWMYRLGRRIVGFSGHYHVTAIAQVLADARAVGFKEVETKSFPLPGPFCLFKITAFTRSEA